MHHLSQSHRNLGGNVYGGGGYSLCIGLDHHECRSPPRKIFLSLLQGPSRMPLSNGSSAHPLATPPCNCEPHSTRPVPLLGRLCMMHPVRSRCPPPTSRRVQISCTYSVSQGHALVSSRLHSQSVFCTKYGLYKGPMKRRELTKGTCLQHGRLTLGMQPAVTDQGFSGWETSSLELSHVGTERDSGLIPHLALVRCTNCPRW